ncbi:class I tRNA ligase family protein [endosymbiont of Pachyrhynchus infernalis]|uniref:class I tRNA ligase family protein n=1 Tax=endosymbiont of Pachyrhynchus infernalis TaxID=1971488 RepID=UPI0038B5BEBB
MNKYNPKKIESYVQKFWELNNTFSVKENYNKKKYYCLSMFPYPSGKIHVGHVRNYTIGDIISRFYRMNNRNVLYPIGWDAFGLPAENAAINNNTSPEEWTLNNINIMRKQLKSLGFSFDWKKEILTCSNKYYIWEQYFLKKLFKNKMLYKKKSSVNWCPYDNTVLSNEQVINNKCWRCDSKVHIKNINQWFIKITKYADKLFYDLDKLNYWPEKVKLMQKNWIGRIEWIETKFKILNNLNIKYINIYLNNKYELTNLDYIVISFQNKISKIILGNKFNFYKKFFNKNNLLKTDIYIEHKLINKKINLFISNNNFIINNFFYKNIDNFTKNNSYIKSFNDINEILNKNKNILLKNAFIISNNSKYDINFNKNNNKLFIKKIIYNLKDWCISRQRYWGTPIPMAKYVKNNFIIPIPDKYLPINVPLYNDFLNKSTKNNIIINNKLAIKDKDTVDTFVQSSWYYIRYISPNYCKMINKELANYWLPIDQYIGGIEHSNMHLLYFRFFNKLMKKFKYIKYSEPSIKLLCQGMILSETFFYLKENKKIWVNFKDVTKICNKENKYSYFFNKIEVNYAGLSKMSKSKNNSVNPDTIIKKYGADTLRMFIIFSAPVKCDFVWNQKNIIGIYRFLNKVWNLVIKFIYNTDYESIDDLYNIKKNKLIIFINKTIDNITNDIKYKQSFNISISSIMKLTNLIKKNINLNKNNNEFNIKILSVLLKLLYPFAPHISFFLWKKLGYKNTIDFETWPKKEDECFNNKIKFIIYINNKFIKSININKDLSKNEILKYIKTINLLFIKKYEFNNYSKIIFIKNKLINILIN